MYDKAEDLCKKIDEYFESLKSEEPVFVEGNDEPIAIREVKRPPTVTGLTLYLGFSHKSSLYEYRDTGEFTDPIKKALTRIEQHHEESLNEKSCTGNIFALKNMGWVDRKEVKTVTEEPTLEDIDKRLRELGLR